LEVGLHCVRGADITILAMLLRMGINKWQRA
jgi:hypothetical protein